MNIGMIVAMPQELSSFLEECGEMLETEHLHGYEVMKYKIGIHTLFVVGSGAGEIAASASAQMLISRYDVDTIVNFGVVGGLTPKMALENTVVVDRVVHYDYDASPFMTDLVPAQYPEYDSIYIETDRNLLNLALEVVPELHKVTCASADKFIEGPEAKKELHEKYGADICEMEAAGILLTCNRNKIPALFIKAVSDSAEGGAEQFGEMIEKASKVCVKAVMKILSK